LNAALAATLASRSAADKDQPNGNHGGGEKEKEKAEKIVGPVIKMLQALMTYEGAMSGGVQEEYVIPFFFNRIRVLTCYF
jgi:sister-chromatid-cohesion protein PDS5